MKVNPDIDIAVHAGVYGPAEDTYLLLEAVEPRGRMLDMGTGTGIIALHGALQGADVTAVDIDSRAVTNARSNAACNGIDIEVVQSDLFAAVQGRFHVIAFNPPYLPARSGDVRWDGGQDGVATAGRFLRDGGKYLEKNGRIYLLLSTLGDVVGLLQTFQGRYLFRQTRRLPLFFEQLLVYEVRPRNTCSPGGDAVS